MRACVGVLTLLTPRQIANNEDNFVVIVIAQQMLREDVADTAAKRREGDREREREKKRYALI